MRAEGWRAAVRTKMRRAPCRPAWRSGPRAARRRCGQRRARRAGRRLSKIVSRARRNRQQARDPQRLPGGVAVCRREHLRDRTGPARRQFLQSDTRRVDVPDDAARLMAARAESCAVRGRRACGGFGERLLHRRIRGKLREPFFERLPLCSGIVRAALGRQRSAEVFSERIAPLGVPRGNPPCGLAQDRIGVIDERKHGVSASS